ncbi:hypothetical protein AD944_00010, partial [Acetobacter tropicalis]
LEMTGFYLAQGTTKRGLIRMAQGGRRSRARHGSLMYRPDALRESKTEAGKKKPGKAACQPGFSGL